MIADWFAGPQNEAEAMRIAMGDDRWARALQGLRAGIRLALDTRDTQQVFYLASAVDRESLPRAAARLAAHPAGSALLRERPAIDSQHVDYAALRALPADTLGGAYARSLSAAQLDPDIFQRPPGLPDDLAYVAQRARQTHDLWHVLTGLPTDIPGEVALQAFTYAQLGQTFSRLIVTFGQLFFGLRYPRMRRMVKLAAEAGRNAEYLLAVRWEDHWAEALTDVRARFNIAYLG